MASVRLKRLRIEKYRNVMPGTELQFNDGFNVLLGKNGTGKTTLLNLIAVLMSDALAPLSSQPFDLTYTLLISSTSISVRLQNEIVNLDQWPQEAYLVWSYEVSLTFLDDPRTHTLKASSKTLPAPEYEIDGQPATRETPPYGRSPFEGHFLSMLLWMAMPLSSGHASEAIVRMVPACNGRFDEALGGFMAITELDAKGDLGSLPSAQISVVASEAGIKRLWTQIFVPDDLAEKIGRHEPTLPETLTFGAPSAHFLDKSTKAMNFKKAAILVRRRSKALRNNENRETATYGGFEFNFTLHDEQVITHRDLSYGEKRLLSFFYYAACSPNTIVADELPNGMHYDWVRACVEEITDRQSFLAGQDPLLFDFLSFESASDVQKSFVLCTREMREDHSRFVWKNLDKETASSFYRAYDAGIQHVSEILRIKGLW